MACTGRCELTRYETEWDWVKYSLGEGCREIQEKLPDGILEKYFKSEAPPARWLENNFQDEHTCPECCFCNLYLEQSPDETEWTDWSTRRDTWTFTWHHVDGTTGTCEISYSFRFRYRTKLLKGNCAKLPPKELFVSVPPLPHPILSAYQVDDDFILMSGVGVGREVLEETIVKLPFSDS